MAAKRNRDFRVRQIETMWARLDTVRGLRTPFLLGGVLVLAGSVFLGLLSAFGILTFVTAMICLGKGIGYSLEAKRLRVSIDTAEARIDTIDEETKTED